MDAPNQTDTTYFGAPVKVLRTTKAADGTETAVLGGHLVLFTGPDSPDLEGDYFTAETDFGTLSRRGAATLPAYYQHGFDPHFRNAAIGDADVTIDEFGVWAEYQIELRSDYERYLVDMASKGLMGQSSGAVGHLVERKQVGKSHHFKTWPLGEASLTPTPAEPRTSAMPLKTFKEWAVRQAAPPFADAAPDATRSTTTTPPEPAMSETTEAAKAVTPEATPTLDLSEVQSMIADQFKALREDMKPAPAPTKDIGAPAIITTGLGDTEAKSLKAWAMGDDGAMKHAASGPNRIMVKASNDTDMNVGTAADGGNAVPTGHYQGIIARRDEDRLNLGVMSIPGVGTTVNVPLDGEADGEFVSTAEAGAFDRDAPALGTAAMTLVKYTKKVELSHELMQDEDSRLMAFLADFVGRGMAKTHNSLLVTEVATNGANLNTTASATVLAAGELEDAVFGNDIANYLSGGAAWVMQAPTYSKVAQLTGADRLYVPQAQGSGVGLNPAILGYPVNFSAKVAAYGTTANKFALFGNFGYVGVREEPSFEVLRDPFSKAANGQTLLHYYFRTVYKVLQSEAVGYIDHA